MYQLTEIIKSLFFSIFTFANVLIILPQEPKIPESYSIFTDISIKKTQGKVRAEFSFYTIHREGERNEQTGEFAEIFIKKIAVTQPKIDKVEMKMVPKKNDVVYQSSIKNSPQKYTVSFLSYNNYFEGVVELNPNVAKALRQVKFSRKTLENNKIAESSLENAVRQIGCKVRKPDGILYDAKFIQWKKDEFKMLNQTVVTASYGMRIWFEEEVYDSVDDAENRLKHFKKVSPEITAEIEKFYHKMHTELDFREAFRKGKKVYFVSVPAYGAWLEGDVAKYRKKLEKAIK